MDGVGYCGCFIILFEYCCVLTHKQLEMLGYVLNTVHTDALVLKHQGISIHSDH